MKDPIVDQLLKEIAQLEAQVNARREMIAARYALNGSANVASIPVLGRERERAPEGHLRDAIIAAIAGTKGLTKMEIVKKLAAQKYEFSVRPAHVARNLGKLRRAGKVKASVKGLANLYSLAK